MTVEGGYASALPHIQRVMTPSTPTTTGTAACPNARRAGRLRGLLRLAGDETGATAVEFALIALPFFALILATIETALVFFAGQALETAVATAARTIRTGQAQSQSLSPADFKTSVCSQLLYLFNCDAGLYIDVKTYANFGAITLGVPVDANGNLKKTDYSYTPGHGSDIVVVNAYYEWPVFINKLGNNLADMPDGTHLLVATAAFRNEPFPW